VTGTVAALVLYLLAVVSIGALAARRAGRDEGEFYLGGRRMSEFVVALSAVVSGRSAWLMMGMVGATFLYGVSMAWFLPGYILMELFLFLFAARRIRHFTERRDGVTFLDYLGDRFGDRSGALRVAAGVVIVVFFTAYVGAQLKAGQVMFAEIFDWKRVLPGIAVVTAIVGIYTVLGGFRAVSITDVVQAVLMILGLVVLPVVGFIKAGGPSAAWTKLGEIAAVDKFSLLGIGSLAGVVSGLGIGLGSPGNPHIIVRYMSIDRPDRLRTAALVGTLWNVLLGWGAVFTGLAARALYSPETLPDPNNQAFVHMATDLFPPFLAGLMLAALLAAIMSTADSQLLVTSSSITRDIYEKVVRKGRTLPPRTGVALGRIVTILVVLAAATLSWISAESSKEGVFASVFSYVLLAWAGLGAAFGPPLLLSLWWKGATRAGALASLISGTATTIFWVASGLKDETKIHEIVPAFGLSLVLMIAVSFLTRPPEDTESLMADMEP
jgi:sodium/proline symporter